MPWLLQTGHVCDDPLEVEGIDDATTNFFTSCPVCPVAHRVSITPEGTLVWYCWEEREELPIGYGLPIFHVAMMVPVRGFCEWWGA